MGTGQKRVDLEHFLKSKRQTTYISRTHNPTDLFHRVQVGAQTAVHSEDLLIDNGGNRQAVEAIGECLPELDVVPPLAFIVEAIDSVNRGALVVSTENEEVFGILDLVREEKADGFEGLLAAVNVVSEEEIVGLWREATVFEKAQKIVILAVNVTANLADTISLVNPFLSQNTQKNIP